MTPLKRNLCALAFAAALTLPAAAVYADETQEPVTEETEETLPDLQTDTPADSAETAEDASEPEDPDPQEDADEENSEEDTEEDDGEDEDEEHSVIEDVVCHSPSWDSDEMGSAKPFFTVTTTVPADVTFTLDLKEQDGEPKDEEFLQITQTTIDNQSTLFWDGLIHGNIEGSGEDPVRYVIEATIVAIPQEDPEYQTTYTCMVNFDSRNTYEEPEEPDDLITDVTFHDPEFTLENIGTYEPFYTVTTAWPSKVNCVLTLVSQDGVTKNMPMGDITQTTNEDNQVTFTWNGLFDGKIEGSPDQEVLYRMSVEITATAIDDENVVEYYHGHVSYASTFSYPPAEEPDQPQEPETPEPARKEEDRKEKDISVDVVPTAVSFHEAGSVTLLAGALAAAALLLKKKD